MSAARFATLAIALAVAGVAILSTTAFADPGPDDTAAVKTRAQNLADRLSKIQRLAAVSSIRLVRRPIPPNLSHRTVYTVYHV